MRSVQILTLGCRVNQYDSQVLRELAVRAGFRLTDDPASASCVVLDSCTVTAASDAEARRLLRRARRLNPEAVIVLVGCIPPDAKGLPADLVLGNKDKFKVFDLMEKSDIRHRWMGMYTDTADHNEKGTKQHWPVPITSFAGHKRPILKVQDGCRFACSFCAVPRVRGTAVSRPMKEIVEEARGLAGSGAKELVLTGVQLSSYGMDRGLKAREPRLAPVVEALFKVPGVRRVRLSSYGVADFEEGLLSLVGEEDGLCPHFHLPLQSGDERILRSMKRPYTIAGFRRIVERIRRRVPHAGLTTDVIAGFPGETKEAFRNTLERLADFGFRDLHPFPYSERPGTTASGLSPKVTDVEVRERMSALLSIKQERLHVTARELEGAIRWVVAEDHSAALCGGTTAEGVRVIFPREEGLVGRETWVRLGKIRMGQIDSARVK